MAIDPNNPLLNGPRRFVKQCAIPLDTTPLLTAPATFVRSNKSRSYRKEKSEAKKAAALPSPTSPEFDSTKHGLLAPPKTRNLKNGKYID